MQLLGLPGRSVCSGFPRPLRALIARAAHAPRRGLHCHRSLGQAATSAAFSSSSPVPAAAAMEPPGAAAAAPSAAALPPKPREEPPGMAAEAALLEAFCQVPTLGRGWCFPAAGNSGGEGGVRVALQTAQRNLPSNAQRKFVTHLQVNEAVLEAGEVDASPPLELKDALVYAPSPSGAKTLVVRAGAGEASAVLEVWGRGRLLQELHVPKGLHGALYNDGWFGAGAAWSPDESKLAYVAEAPADVKTPEWGARLGPEGKKWDGAAPKGWRGVGEWTEDWGELNTGKRHPALFVLDCSSWEVSAVQGLPEDASCGQPAWAPEGDMLLFVAWPHRSTNFPQLSRRLGMVFCFNRPCALYAAPWPQRAQQAAAAVCLTPSLASAFSPRIGPMQQPAAAQQLVFLSQAAAVASGVHSATSALHSISWEATRAAVLGGTPPPAPRTLVAPVWNAQGDDFPGLYCSALPDQPFLAGEPGSEGLVVLTTQWRSLTAVVVVDLGSGQLSRVTPANGTCWSLVASGSGWLVAQESSPSLPSRLYAAHVSPKDAADPGAWCWSRLPLPADDLPEQVQQAISQVAVDTLRLTPSIGSRDVQYEAVVLHRKDLPGPRPTILYPHGGPHSAYTAQFFMPLSFMLALGYNVLLLNYRGSTGFGEASIQSLPGHVSVHDVRDCWDSLQAAVEKGYADPQRVAVIGGSHGGFLTGHLVGQYPDAFRCAVLRNPVCDISLMIHVSDIPDWCYVEAWGPEEGKRRAAHKPTGEEIQHMWSISPAAHIDEVKCPLFFMLGAKDRRVPQEDARQYVHALRARLDAPETRVIVFPEDTHALDKPQTEFEQWLNSAWWLKTHIAAPTKEQAPPA